MKKWVRLIGLMICLIFLTACGNKVSSNDEVSGTQRVDIAVEKQEVAADIEGSEGKRFLGMQFLEDESIQLWGLKSEGEQETMDVYLYREDGSTELLVEKVPVAYINKSCFVDKTGNLYCLSREYFMKLSPKGEELFKYSKNSMDVNVSMLCQVPDGRIYAWVSEKVSGYGTTGRLAEVDPDTGKLTEIKNVQSDFAVLSLGYNAEGLVWLDQNGIWTVDITEGKVTCIMSFVGKSYVIPVDSAIIHRFRVTEDDHVLLLMSEIQGEKNWIETLELQPVQEEKITLVVRGFHLGGGWFKEQVAEFNRMSEKYYVVLEELTSGTDSEDFARQTSVEIATGKGPDIIYGEVVEEYISGMLEKGAFVDLSEFMEASGVKEEDYFPCAFSSWRDGEKIYGVNMTVNLTGYRIEEEVLGSREIPDVETLVDALLAYQGEAVCTWNYNSAAVVQMLLEGSEDLWGMIDWEKGTCDFGGELFAKILQVAKRYGHEGMNEYPQLISVRRSDHFYMYDSLAEQEKEGKVTVGTLFDDGCYASIVSQWKIMAINGNSAQKEGAWEFIRFLLGEEAQSNMETLSDVPVNRKAFDSMVAEERKKLAQGHKRNLGTVQIVNGKVIENNRVYSKDDITDEKVEEFIRNIETARPLPLQTVPIQDIIFEEAQYYFDGMKSIEEVVEIIENRVQLYLEEHK